jgi:hypothetical protein
VPPFFKSFDELILVILFVVLPLLQRVFAHLKQRRSETTARERARRTRDGLDLPPASTTDEPESSGADRWRELLSRVEEDEEHEEVQVEPAAPPPRPPAPPPRPAVARPAPPQPAATLAGPLATFEPEALGGLSAVPSEEQLEAAAAAPRAPLAAMAELEAFDLHEAVESLAEVPGLTAVEATSTSVAGGRAVLFALGWRRAVVVSELLLPPVSLRPPEGRAPGLADLV